MGTIKFGKSQLSNPTPSNINLWVRVYTAVAGCVVAWLPTSGFIPDKITVVVASILGLTITISNIVAPFFGITFTQDSIQAKDVTAADSNSTDK